MLSCQKRRDLPDEYIKTTTRLQCKIQRTPQHLRNLSINILSIWIIPWKRAIMVSFSQPYVDSLSFGTLLLFQVWGDSNAVNAP